MLIRQRPAVPSNAGSFGKWTRDPHAGVLLRFAGRADQILKLGPKGKRADQVVKFLGPDVPKDLMDQVVSDVTGSRDDGRDDFVSRWLLSDGTVDSYDSTLAYDGWRLDNFKRNPVVLLAHDHEVQKALPIGEDVGVYMDPSKKALMGMTRYVSQELAGADSIEAKAVRWVRAGFLRAVSVGFEPLKFEVSQARDDGNSYFVPMDFKEQELREYSVVPVPANPNSLQDGRAFSGLPKHDIERFAEDIERSLDGAGWLALPRATLEKMRKAAVGTRMQVVVEGTSFVVERQDATDYAGDSAGQAGMAMPDKPSPDTKAPAPAGTEPDPNEMMKCPACGYSGPEMEFLYEGPTLATKTGACICLTCVSKLATRANDTIEEAPKETTVQTLVFDKETFKSADDAKAWAKDHDFRADKVDETDESYRLRQRDPGDFEDGSFRTIDITSGVVAVIGKLKEGRGAKVDAASGLSDAAAVRVAAITAEVAEAMDAFERGRLP